MIDPVIDRPLIAAVHATSTSIPPLRAALAEELPDAQLWNLIDDRMGSDADTLGGELGPELRDRMLNLVRHGITGGADAVLIACSMYGEVQVLAEKLFSTPVFASDADMLADLVRAAPKRVAVLTSLRGAAADTTARLANVLGPAEVVPVFCAGAAEAAAYADVPALVESLATGLESTIGPFDMACIAQYSLSPAADGLATKTGLPVASPTKAAARAIARRLSAP